MSLKQASFAPMLVGALIAAAPIAGGDPVWPVAAEESAAATIRDLEAQGYTVQINWVNGRSTEPLDLCRATAIHNPDRSAESPPPESTTVYVDVSCPHLDDDWGWRGIGVGFGF